MPSQAEIDRAAKEVVARSRLGDQNATGMILATKRKAEEGNPRARVAFQAMSKHAKAAPHGDFGGEGLARVHGPMIYSPNVSKVVYTGGGLGVGAWLFGPWGALAGGALGWFLSR